MKSPKAAFILFSKKLFKKACIYFIAIFVLFLLLNILFPLPYKKQYSTIVFDNKKQLLHAFITPDEKWRMKTNLEEISPLLKKVIIEKEDKYFKWHIGVNPIAVCRAAIYNLFTGRRMSGASTISMQVARMLQPKKRNVANKLIEMFRALQLEWKFSKDEILQMYLNLVPYGGNIEGVKSASWIYLNKNPDNLSLAEIVSLSIIPNRPTSLVPGKNNPLIIAERNKWLKRFAEEKLFTEKQIADALSEPFDAYRRQLPQLAPHIALKLKQQEGDIIYSFIDANSQFKSEKIIEDYVRTLKPLNINNAAAIVIDNETKQIVSYVGSASFFDSTDGGQVNGAAAIRQPGSTLKPLLYGLCMDAGLITPKMTIADVAVNYNGYVPENYDQKFNGYVTAEYALEHSLNIPAVKMLSLIGKEKMISSLSLCNFKQIQKDQHKLGLSLILGGCGASLEELTGLFSAIATEGMYSMPKYSVENSTSQKYRILSSAASFMLHEQLSKVNRPDFPFNWQATDNLPKIAWKTGTSYGRRDAWSIGYNKKYTIGVWVGNFSGQGVPELSGASIATPLLFKLFNTLNYNSSQNWFTQPITCETRIVCTETGLPPTEHCTNIVTDYFIPLVSATGTCTNNQEIMMSADEQMSYCVHCKPENNYKKKWIKKIEPTMQAYFDENKINYDKIPPHNPNCEKLFYDKGPFIKSPTAGTEYLISKENPEPLQLQCQPEADVSKIYWYINDKFYKQAQAKEKIFFMPQEGLTKISCTDDKGRNRNITITVKFVNL